ncbi:PP2C family protein-serine/threonine phosphatase [Azospirillum sp. TSH64]|uniref:PP2C family protein-serine/threonine phosphatase n=1 Tax=Azospirillum sp. TSH64 TaxID=652740 RepID=UPI001FFEBEC8|nr:PP2C family protein-serine/threonine phosphatase [Azospirillum sp. TSH64]
MRMGIVGSGSMEAGTTGAGLGGRMFVFAAGAVLAVLATAVLFAVLWGDRTAERRVAEETRVAQRLWESLMEEEAVVMQRAAADPLLVAALDRNNGQAAAARLPLLGFSSAALVNSVGQPQISVPAPTDMRLIDERRVAQVLAQNDAYTGLVVVGGAVQHMVAAPFGETRPVDRVVLALRTVQPSLTVLARVLGGSAYLVDGNGALYDRAGALPWEDIQPSLGGGGGDHAKVHRSGRSFEVRTLRLADPAGGNTLALVVARESTLEDMATSLFDTSAILVLMTVLAASLFGLEWFFRRSLAPIHASLSALSALADGNTNVAVLGAERSDEAGRLARTVEVFRNRSRALQDAEARRGRHWLRQQSFIRKQMLRMAETLPDQGRVELLGDLDRIESVTGRGDGAGGDGAGGLAVAFEVMAERVRSQHAALDGMVVQLRASLDTKTELVELQKQFEIARRMQQAILPAGLPARPDLAAAGLLLPAAEFDGSFYDFFLADDDTLVVLLGQVSGGGLAGGFMTVTARTAVRALASAGLGPGACLTGANRLLAADNAAGLRIGLAMGVVTLRNRRFVFAGAGVPAPFLARRLGDVVDLPVAENPPLGLDAGLTVAETAFDLPVPSTLVLCGSGLLDGTNRFDMPFGRTHMGEVLSGLDDLSADSTVAAVQAALFEHAGGRTVPMARDRTCLAVRVRA